jgi:hypothetical protein
MYEIVDQFIYLGSQINSKSVIKDEIRLRIEAGNRSMFANKNLLKIKISTPSLSYRYTNPL